MITPKVLPRHVEIEKRSYAGEMMCLGPSLATIGSVWMPFSNLGRNVDHRSIILERSIAELKGGKGIKVDERDHNCFDNDNVLQHHLSRLLHMIMARRIDLVKQAKWESLIELA